MGVLYEVSVEFPKTKEFIDEKLEQKCSKENISKEKVIYFSLISQAICGNFCIVQCQILKNELAKLLELHLNSYVKEYNV